MATTKKQDRRPLTPWELPSLLTPVHTYRRRKRKPGKVRKHFPAILGFIYRNRFAVASQVQRRFARFLRSDRTARRHLTELEALGWIDLVPTRSVGPLFPKVYYVTGRGVRTLRERLSARGTDWSPTRIDRRSRASGEGYTAEHVLHEVLTTEFLLNVWETVHGRDDLELLQVERRSLAKNPGLQIGKSARNRALRPDGMFVFRQAGRGMCCCFVELDLGTMNREQLETKFQRYDDWSRSTTGCEFLLGFYERHGARTPRPEFRILVVTTGRAGTKADAREKEIRAAARVASRATYNRVWTTTTENLCTVKVGDSALNEALWWKSANDAGITGRFSLFEAQ